MEQILIYYKKARIIGKKEETNTNTPFKTYSYTIEYSLNVISFLKDKFVRLIKDIEEFPPDSIVEGFLNYNNLVSNKLNELLKCESETLSTTIKSNLESPLKQELLHKNNQNKLLIEINQVLTNKTAEETKLLEQIGVLTNSKVRLSLEARLKKIQDDKNLILQISELIKRKQEFNNIRLLVDDLSSRELFQDNFKDYTEQINDTVIDDDGDQLDNILLNINISVYHSLKTF